MKRKEPYSGEVFFSEHYDGWVARLCKGARPVLGSATLHSAPLASQADAEAFIHRNCPSYGAIARMEVSP